ncbi:transcriptional regulator [Thalassotalea sp. M1531]|uniref:Transcriptional regulator n=2 Tax=Thalassotalea algicola TaxID=2716224 RepID=A0A7Y0LCR2_9GAMM|nr:transcriptional regulator [Thalassotalea algicola]
MRYYFEQFEFDANSLTLKHNQQTIAIRHNEALLLKLLLENNQSVVSKDTILSEVWQGKVVSEQAVFQNISHLRSLFGGNAIKTFAKRGYQWQLTFQCQNAESPIQPVNVPSTAQQTRAQNKTHWRLIAFIAVLLIGFVSYFSSVFSVNKESKPQVAIVPFTFTNMAEQEVPIHQLTFKVNELKNISAQQYEATQILSYQSLKQSHPLILSGSFWRSEKQVHLDFLLKGLSGDWQGQMSGTTIEQLTKNLAAHLQQPFILEMVTKPLSPEVKQARLSIAHQESPKDLLVLNRLVDTYITMEQYDTAMTLADKLEQLAIEENNPQQLGNALLFQSSILTNKEIFELSNHKLMNAQKAFEAIKDDRRLADTYNARSWLDHQNSDYNAIKKHLLLSAKHALAVNDIERELHALTYLSVLAHKHKRHDDKYLYLQQAESKMDGYKLPQYHYAKIPFHHAIYSNSPAQREPHLKQVLTYTEHTPNHWVAQSSRRQLLDYYISSGRLNLASELVNPLDTTTPENTLLKARLAKELKQQEQYQTYGKQAFEQAQLAGKRSLSLDIALLMCDEPDKQINYDFYFRYIEEHATEYWSRRNQQKLHAINIQ